MIKKFMGFLLCVCLLVSAFPAFAAAGSEMCENHIQHTEDCGFAPAVEESCQHQCADACYTYAQNCLHPNCPGCTYVPAVEAYVCPHVCETTVCGFIAPTQGNPCNCPADENGTVIHVENCGFVAATQGSPCLFHGVNPACTCTAEQPETYVCYHTCTVDSGCITSVYSCTHTTHDESCGYVPAYEGSPCAHSCELCKPPIPDNTDDTTGDSGDTATPHTPIIYPGCAHHKHDENCGGLLNNCTYVCQTCVYEIQQMVNALPDYVTPENQAEVEAACSAIHQRYILISTAAFSSIDWTKFERVTYILATPPNWFGFAIQKSMDWVSEGLVCNFAFIDCATGAPATLVAANGASCTSFDLIPNGAGAFFYLPAGTYTIVEQVEGDWILSTTVNGAAAFGNTFTGEAGNSYSLVVENTFEPGGGGGTGTPSYTAPGPYSANYGDKLSAITLPDGFVWENPDSLVGDVGKQFHRVTYSPDDASSEIITGIEVTVNVTKAKVQAPQIIQNIVYNGTEQTLAKAAADTVVCIGENADGTWSVDAKALYSGTYKVWYKHNTDEDNYEQGFVEVTIAKAPITVKAKDATAVFGDGIPNFTTAVTGTVYSGDTLNFETELIPPIAMDVGEYDIIPSVSANSTGAGNYDITLENGTFTIIPAELTIVPNVTSKTYGADEPELTFKAEGFKGSESDTDIEGSLTRESGGDVGEYDFYVSGLDAGKNYTLKIKEGAKFTITPATPTAADFMFTPPAEKIATGGEVFADIAVKPDVTGIGAVTVGYYNDKGEAATPKAAGTYTVKIDVAAGTNYSAASGITDDDWTITLLPDPADTENTKKVEDIDKDNVKPENKTDLEKAKEDLEKALEENKDKYTEEQKKEIQADIDRIDEALKAIPASSVQYTITYGNHSYWYKGSYYSLGFRCDGPLDKLERIYVDNIEVSSQYCSVTSGSTILTLYPNLLYMLQPGAHSVTFDYTDGYATGYFYVLKAPINAVMTGDDSNGGLMALMLSLSLMGLTLSLGALKRRKTQ